MPFQKGNKYSPGRPKGSINKDRKEVIDIFKEASPKLLQLAIDRAVGKGKKTGDNNLLKELVKKALPDNVNINMEVWTRQLSDDELWAEMSRLEEVIEKIKCLQSRP